MRNSCLVTIRLPHLIVPNVVSIMLEIVEILQIDLQQDDDNVEVHHLKWEGTSSWRNSRRIISAIAS